MEMRTSTRELPATSMSSHITPGAFSTTSPAATTTSIPIATTTVPTPAAAATSSTTTTTTDTTLSPLCNPVTGEMSPVQGFPENVWFLRSPFTNAEIFLVGTAHVSTSSIANVERSIELASPDQLLVELCPARRLLLTLTEEDLRGSLETAKRSFFDVFRVFMDEGWSFTPKVFESAISWYSMQVGFKLDMFPGAEMRAAYRAFENNARQRNAPSATITLGDRNVEATLKRAWAALSMFEKLKFLFYICFDSLPTQAEVDLLTSDKNELNKMMMELTKSFPSLVDPLIRERDMYLAQTLRMLPGPRAVGVVGLGHVEGILSHWQSESFNLAELSRIPDSRPVWWWKPWFKWVLIVGVPCVTVYGSYRVTYAVASFVGSFFWA
eukprot:gnl/Spiro4/24497_TR12137_c0_g1_i1.p1 gnl/Spiro4/24497_TR12137_c0_g1~~gnl/Spiro4/24497_TR12137_c0_g1_i1.p1  ORF type:complete len:382 (+),score=56.18 gnl/Spiro4/24497_TR12137_c0_g1_i1:147-1292(+)